MLCVPHTSGASSCVKLVAMIMTCAVSTTERPAIGSVCGVYLATALSNARSLLLVARSCNSTMRVVCSWSAAMFVMQASCFSQRPPIQFVLL